jgi:two-component system NtrC family sensor kinase
MMMMDPEAERRLAFLRFDAADRDRLAELAPIFEEHADDFVETFYRHLLSFPTTRALLADPEVKERLLEKQRQYLLGLATPAFDAAFVAERRAIGVAHERIGLDPQFYLGSYRLYVSLLRPIVAKATRDQEHAETSMEALEKVLSFDTQLAMEAYIESRERQLEYLTGELSEQSRELARQYEEQSATLRRTTERASAAEQLAGIGTLVAGLAHEIGTPMGVIQGHAKLLSKAISGDDAKWRLTTIQSQIERIARIIQSLLSMARPRAPRRTPVALAPLLENTLSFLSEKLQRNDIETKLMGSDAAVVVEGDSERLQQLFLNLFLNAADAMPDGGTLQVRSNLLDDGGVEVRVSDTGMGIAARDLERVFDPFFTTKTASEGNGLGLMVCNGIVNEHAGRIEVSSSEGQGTEFRILFPPPGDSPQSDSPPS